MIVGGLTSCTIKQIILRAKWALSAHSFSSQYAHFCNFEKRNKIHKELSALLVLLSSVYLVIIIAYADIEDSFLIYYQPSLDIESIFTWTNIYLDYYIIIVHRP